MAEFGAKYPCFKPNGASHGFVLGKLAAANLTVNLASGELYADDSLAEQLSEFSSGSSRWRRTTCPILWQAVFTEPRS